jgi:hypothetical protein
MHDPVIDCSVWIKEEKPTLALSPVHDVLADEVLEEFRLAAPGRARHVEMAAALFSREYERRAAATLSDEQVVTGRSSHISPRTPQGASHKSKMSQIMSER